MALLFSVNFSSLKTPLLDFNSPFICSKPYLLVFPILTDTKKIVLYPNIFNKSTIFVSVLLFVSALLFDLTEYLKIEWIVSLSYAQNNLFAKIDHLVRICPFLLTKIEIFGNITFPILVALCSNDVCYVLDTGVKRIN